MFSDRPHGPSSDGYDGTTIRGLGPWVDRTSARTSELASELASGLASGLASELAEALPNAVTDVPRDSRDAAPAARAARTVAADDGLELYVEVGGRADAELTMVFCHGLALHLDCWSDQRTAFADQARLVLYDQRGHGRSGRGPAGSATITQLGRDLYRVLEEVVPSGPVVLVGHSMGGMAIMALAEAHPDLFRDRVAGVALMATSAGGLDHVTLGLPAYGARLLQPFVPGLLKVLAGTSIMGGHGHRAVADLLHLLVRRYSFASNVSPAVWAAAVRIIDSTPIEVIGDFYATLLAHDGRAALAVLRNVPTLILVGGDDMVTPVEHSEAIAYTLPGAALVVLPRTGHNLMLERPRTVNSSLGELLRRAPGRRPSMNSPAPASPVLDERGD
ncbi:alpha/beta fold hydrolase [Microtetraspora malaysiensis]|uniref:alpha/beta fold hydrolase n=1 Tax=Microtetraspora malaysiensis TaxID=161358 RepID=UPI003D9056C9